MHRPGECRYFAYRCGNPVLEGSKYCDYHKYLIGVLLSLLGSCGILALTLYLTVIFPSFTLIIFLVGLAVCGLWIYRAVEQK